MGDITDTQRLDWVIYNTPRFGGDHQGIYVVFWHCGDGHNHIARGDSERSCIDAALTGLHERID